MIRHVPLRRGDSRLRRATRWLRRETPLPKTGPRTRENLRARARIWPRLMERSQGLCENRCGHPATDWDHVFGRPGSGACLGRWANSVELTEALCRLCHELKTDCLMCDAELLALRMAAYARLCKRAGHRPLRTLGLLDVTGAVRQLVSELEQRGEQP